MSLLLRFLKDKTGATAIEYSLLGSLIALAIIGGAGAAGENLDWLWGNNNSEIVKALNKN